MNFSIRFSQSNFVGVQAMYLALLLASRIARALDGPEGGGADKRCRISFGLCDLRGICIPSPQKYVKLFFLEKFLKPFYIFM